MMIVRALIPLVCFAVPTATSVAWVGSAAERAEQESQAASAAGSDVAVAAAANEEYCTRDLKVVLRRVLKSCGLLDAAGTTARGCQPVTAQQVATMSGTDFNSLFIPMKERGGLIQFDQGQVELDDSDRALVDQVFSSQKGASYFFVVARASPEGTEDKNREISKSRAEGLMNHLRATFKDPDLEREVGLLWLGEEFAQLDDTFCEWSRSGEESTCSAEDINRSAFVAWIDCRL